MVNKAKIRKVVVKEKTFKKIWSAIKDRDIAREEKRRLVSKKGKSYLDELNCILFEIQDDIKHAKKRNLHSTKNENELQNLLALLTYFRNKSLSEQRLFLDSLRVREESFLTDL